MQLFLHACSFFHEYLGNTCDAAAGFSKNVHPLPLPLGMPAGDIRRLTPASQLALYLASDAATQSGFLPSELCTVFASAQGDSQVFNDMCLELDAVQPQLSPTQFSHSLLSTSAGLWGIAAQSEQRSLSVSSGHHTFAIGLLEAALMALERPCLLVYFSVRSPPLLSSTYLVDAHCGCAMVLSSMSAEKSMAELCLKNLTYEKPTITARFNELIHSSQDPLLSIGAFLEAIVEKKSSPVVMDLSKDLSLSIEMKWKIK